MRLIRIIPYLNVYDVVYYLGKKFINELTAFFCPRPLMGKAQETNMFLIYVKKEGKWAKASKDRGLSPSNSKTPH